MALNTSLVAQNTAVHHGLCISGCKEELRKIPDETTLCTHRKPPTGYSNRMQFVTLT